jgi:outer membrane protein
LSVVVFLEFNMRTALIAAALAVAAPGFALAAEPQPQDQPEGWTVTLGAAAVASPVWQGSDDTAVSLFPDLRVGYKDVFFASLPDGVGWNAINSDGWKAGPIAKIRFGRDEEDGGSPFRISGDSDALIGLGDVDAAVEVGGFIEKRFGDREQWRVKAEARRGFGGHEGVLLDASATYQARFGYTLLNVGPKLTVASEDYMQTYFGIDPLQSVRSGLPTYQADGGLLSYGLSASLIQPLNRRSAIMAFASYDRLAENAADSPLVRLRGDENQFTIGIGYGLRFGF